MAMASNRSPFVLAGMAKGNSSGSNTKPTRRVEWLSSAENAQPHPWPHRHPFQPPSVLWPRCVPTSVWFWLAALCSVAQTNSSPGPPVRRPGGDCGGQTNRTPGSRGSVSVVFPSQAGPAGGALVPDLERSNPCSNTSTGCSGATSPRTVQHRSCAWRGLRPSPAP